MNFVRTITVWRSAMGRNGSLAIRGIAVLSLLSGCQSLQSNSKKPHEPWDQARSDVQLHLASELLSVGSIADAESKLDEARRLAKNDTDAVRLIEAKIELAKGNFGRVREVVAEISTDAKERAEAEYLLGVAFLSQQAWLDAAERFRNALRLAPTEVEYALAAIQALLQGGRFDEADELINARAAETGWTPGLYVALAECEEQRGRWEAAANAWIRASDGAADRPELRSRAGMALYRAGRPADAASRLRDEVDAAGDSTPIATRLALVDCLIDTHDIAGARSVLAPLFQEAAQDARVMRRLAQILAMEGRTRDALQTLDALLRDGPADAVTLELAAAIAQHGSQPKRAAEYARRLTAATSGQTTNPIAERILSLSADAAHGD